MKKTFIVFKNSEATTTRVLPFRGEELELIYRHDTRRVEFCPDTKALAEEKIEFARGFIAISKTCCQ